MYLFLKKNFYHRFIYIFYFAIVSNIFTIGTSFFKYSYLITLLSILFFLNYNKINKNIFFINFICVLVILYFKKIDITSIAFIFFLIFGSFKYELKNNFNLNNMISKKNDLLLGCIVFILIFLNLSPSSKNFYVNLTVNTQEKMMKQLEEKIIISNNSLERFVSIRRDENNQVIPFNSYFLNKYCFKKNSSNIDSNCYKKFSFYLINRMSINNLDPNFFSCLILFFTIFYFQSKKKKLQIIDYILISSIFIVLVFITKSRTLVVYGLIFFLLYFISKEKKFSFLKLFLIINCLIFLYSVIYYNLSQLNLVNIIDHNKNTFFRLINLNDHSIKIRFLNIFNTLNFQLTNLDKIIFPGSDIMFKQNYIINANIYNNYNPHNFFLAMIKDYGIIVTSIVIFNLTIFFKKFNSTNFLSLILASSFFGYALIILFTFILFQNIKSNDDI
jgi:hypothetical protein